MFLGFHHSPPPKLKFLETRMKKKTKKIKIKTISKANIKKKKKKVMVGYGKKYGNNFPTLTFSI